MWLGVGTSAMSLLAIAGFARSVTSLFAMMAFAGIGNAVIQPAANLALARGVRPERRGLAFGAKQAALPVASAIGGFAVPVLGLTLGWRYAYVAASLIAIAGFILPLPDAPGPVSSTRTTLRFSAAPGSLWLMNVGGMLGTAATFAMSAYLVEAAISSGWQPGSAGTLFGIGSTLAVLSRLGIGWYSDRMTAGWMLLVGQMMLAGSVGIAMLAFLGDGTIVAFALPLAFAGAWGYSGLFVYSIVRLHPDTPASASGFIQMGVFAGAVFGPILFGIVSDTVSYGAAWVMLAVMCFVGGVFMLLGRRALFAERARAA
jgi:predicted MFS family arabinose efflux permease